MIQKKVQKLIIILILLYFLPGCSLKDGQPYEIPIPSPAADPVSIEAEPSNEVISSTKGVIETEPSNQFTSPTKGAEEVNMANNSEDLSGYITKLPFGNYSVSTKPVTIVTDRALVQIEENIVYPENLGDIIEETIGLIEQETGLSYLPDNKLLIFVQSSSFASGSREGIRIEQMDMFPDQIETIFHELSHKLHLQTCTTNSQMFMEGFAIVNAMRISEKSQFLNLFDPFFNYSRFKNEELMLSDPESYLQEVNGWDAYMAGFRFVYFLEEKYGSRICPQIFKSIRELYLDGCNSSELMDVIKRETSENVFSDFQQWYKSKGEIFKRSHPTVNLEGTKYLEVYPVYNDNYKGFPLPRFTYQDNITLDFSVGFGYLQYHGHHINGIFGTVESEGEHMLSFFDASGELICTKQVNNSMVRLDTPGAVKIEITGDGSLIYVVPEFDLIAD